MPAATCLEIILILLLFFLFFQMHQNKRFKIKVIKEIGSFEAVKKTSLMKNKVKVTKYCFDIIRRNPIHASTFMVAFWTYPMKQLRNF